MRKGKLGIQRFQSQRQPICHSVLDLGFSVPIVHRGQTPPGPLSGRRFRNTKEGCTILTLKNLRWIFGHLRFALCFKALDLLAMPASQAFAERAFSLTGDLTSARRNRARTTLERSAFLKLNKFKIVDVLVVVFFFSFHFQKHKTQRHTHIPFICTFPYHGCCLTNLALFNL